MKQTLKYILGIGLENLKYAEGKHAISIALSSAILVFVSEYLLNVSRLATVFSLISIVFFAISIGFNVFALMSRETIIKQAKKIKPNKKIESKINFTYYEDIAYFDAGTYLTYLIDDYGFPKNYEVDAFEIDLAQQILMNAKVISIKFLYYNKSIKLIGGGIFFTLIMVIMASLGL